MAVRDQPPASAARMMSFLCMKTRPWRRPYTEKHVGPWLAHPRMHHTYTQISFCTSGWPLVLCSLSVLQRVHDGISCKPVLHSNLGAFTPLEASQQTHVHGGSKQWLFHRPLHHPDNACCSNGSTSASRARTRSWLMSLVLAVGNCTLTLCELEFSNTLIQTRHV